MRRALAPLLLASLLSACSFAYRVEIEPPDAAILVGGEPAVAGAVLRLPARSVTIEASRRGYLPRRAELRHAGLLGVEELRIELERERHQVTIGLVKDGAEYLLDGKHAGRTPFTGLLESGPHVLELPVGDFPAQSFPFEIEGPGTRRFRPRLRPEELGGLRQIGVYPCGRAPKQVNFSPDGSRLHVALLEGRGFDVLYPASGRVERVEVPGYGPSVGFVEGLFVPGTPDYLVTQMTRDMIHEFRAGPGSEPAMTWVRSLPTRGTWSKVAAYSPASGALAISNWVSGDVSILDYASGEPRRILRGLGVPRGLAFSPDGSSLTVASFGTGRLLRFDTATWELRDSLARPGGALRHVVATRDGTRLFASDMARSEVLEIDAADFRVLHVYPTGENPNTIDLTGDGRFLAVSCRGPNNPAGYILRSPAPGTVLVFDTGSKALVATVTGGAQPTGLDISDDDRLLAFSNFQDAEVELFDLSALTAR